MKKQTLAIAVLALALVISLTVNIVLWCTWSSVKEEPSQEPVQPPLVTADPERKMMEITTPYGVVQYPEEYRAVLVHEGNQNEAVYTHTFSMVRGEAHIELFALHIGDEEQGTLIGWVDANGTQLPITVTSTAITSDDTWSVADTERFTSMQMAINDVIASVQKWKGFRK